MFIRKLFLLVRFIPFSSLYSKKTQMTPFVYWLTPFIHWWKVVTLTSIYQCVYRSLSCCRDLLLDSYILQLAYWHHLGYRGPSTAPWRLISHWPCCCSRLRITHRWKLHPHTRRRPYPRRSRTGRTHLALYMER